MSSNVRLLRLSAFKVTDVLQNPFCKADFLKVDLKARSSSYYNIENLYAMYATNKNCFYLE